MKISYRADGWTRHTEEDDFENGCLPNTACTDSGNDVFEADTLPLLFLKLQEFVGEECPDALSLSACDEINRVDISKMENAAGFTATATDIEGWKTGNCRLWDATYTFYIYRSEDTPVNLNEIKE